MSGNDAPLVSVVIPCYNHEMYVQECIKSVIDQNYKNIELIIIDDGSTDNSVDKINEMLSLCYLRFVNFEFRSRPNRGLSETLNEALAWAKGEFFGPIASDDTLHCHKTSVQVSFLLRNESHAAVFGGYHYINEKSQIIKTFNKPIKSYKFNDVFLRTAFLPAPSALIRTKSLRNVNGYDNKVVIEDLYIWLKLTANGNTLVNCGQVVVNYRFHANNFSKKFDQTWSCINEILTEYKMHPNFKNALANSLLRHASEIQPYDRNKAFKYVKDAFFLFPRIVYKLLFLKLIIKIIIVKSNLQVG